MPDLEFHLGVSSRKATFPAGELLRDGATRDELCRAKLLLGACYNHHDDLPHLGSHKLGMGHGEYDPFLHGNRLD